MNILVTGGAGFVGANLVRMLLENGHRVRILDNFSTGRREYLRRLKIEVVDGDILDRGAVIQTIEGVEGVVHLAAQTGVPGSLEDPFRDCEVNVTGTLNLLEAARRANVKRFVFASSNAPLGRQIPPATEDKAPLPISPYGASKLAGEGYCLAYHGSWGLGTVVLRFANLYGPYSGHKNSVVAKFFRDILHQGKISIHGDGSQTRDFIYVKDLCGAVLLALCGDVSGEVFQIATGVETSIQELASLVQRVADREFNIHYASARQGDIRKNYSGIDKANTLLSWFPKTDLAEGLKASWHWFQNEQSL